MQRNSNIPSRVVVIGAGFGGLAAARALGKVPVKLTVLDRRNYHLFQLLLYQGRDRGAESERHRGANPAYRATAEEHDRPSRRGLANRRPAGIVLVDGVKVPYDYLIVAAGTTDSYFGHDEWRPFAPGLKTVEDALEMRRRILVAFERAEWEKNATARRELLTFVIVGGGPTGVELAGALAEIAHHALARDFRDIDPAQATVILLEAADRLLPVFPRDLSRKAADQLASLGVVVRVGTRVTKIEPEAVWLGDERIGARTALWAAGVAASPLARSLDAALDPNGRVRVLPDLSVPGHPEIFVIGDLAALEENGKPVPGLAPAAMQEGRHAAANVLRTIEGKPLLAFHYVDKGTLATIGRAAAVADIRGWKISGFFAWIAWLGIHIFSLIGFRNRLLVMIEWAWAYVTWQRGARLITERTSGESPSDLR
jgi:NADH dehydrogenase